MLFIWLLIYSYRVSGDVVRTVVVDDGDDGLANSSQFSTLHVDTGDLKLEGLVLFKFLQKSDGDCDDVLRYSKQRHIVSQK